MVVGEGMCLLCLAGHGVSRMGSRKAVPMRAIAAVALAASILQLAHVGELKCWVLRWVPSR